METGRIREAYDIVLAQQQLRAREAVRAQQHRAQEAVLTQQHKAQEAVVVQKHRAQAALLAQKHKAQLAVLTFQPAAQKKTKLRQRDAHDALMIQQGEALGAVLARHREAREAMQARHQEEREEIVARYQLDPSSNSNQASILGPEPDSRPVTELDAAPAPIIIPELDSMPVGGVSVPELDSTPVSSPISSPEEKRMSSSAISVSEPFPNEKEAGHLNHSDYSDQAQLKTNVLTLLAAAEDKIMRNATDKSQALDHDRLTKAGVDAKYLPYFQDFDIVKVCIHSI